LIIEHNGMSHQNIYQTTRRYMAEDRTRSSSCLIATNLHRDIIIMSVWSHHRQFRETAYRYSRLPWDGVHVFEFSVLQIKLCFRSPHWKASARDAWPQHADTCHV